MPVFPILALPPVKLKVRKIEGILKVFDPLRARYVALTPEEFVRQHFTAWLVSDYHFPESLMANEVSLDVNGLSRRSDTVIFGRDGSPLVVVEYKAPTVSITQDTFDQIARYNMVWKAKYLIVSNGLKHYCCVFDHSNGSYHFIPTIPDWHTISLAGTSEN
ncbi:MAG: type I restriction enzyme HsdR N-terminal domain-containing protein [Muribaculaceae bacterium]|nr:type I restriction enzyme HsdR N-terminal domain-containing protein [Muribaculaceae bacterium]